MTEERHVAGRLYYLREQLRDLRRERSGHVFNSSRVRSELVNLKEDVERILDPKD